MLAVAPAAARAALVPLLSTRGADHELSLRAPPAGVNNGATMSRQIQVLKISLMDVPVPVWRRVAVPAAFTLDRVHRVVQLAMGWQDCHLHSFEIGGVQYGVPDADGVLDLRDEMDHRLDAVAPKDARFSYVYDFGDWWEHRIEVEDSFGADAAGAYPECLDGAGACPPEDVGGSYGYEQFLAAIASPAHPRHAEMREWVGRDFDPAEFDPARVTPLLRRMA
jgi:hypothetical protein